MELETVKEKLALKTDAFNHIQASHRRMSEEKYVESKHMSYVLKRTLAISRAALYEMVDQNRLREWMRNAGSYPREYEPFDVDLHEEMEERKGGAVVCDEIWAAGWTSEEMKMMGRIYDQVDTDTNYSGV